MRISHVALAVASLFSSALSQNSSNGDSSAQALNSRLIADDPLALNAFDSSTTSILSPVQFYDGADCKTANFSSSFPGLSVSQLRARLMWNSIYTKLSGTPSWLSTQYGAVYWLAYMPYSGQTNVTFQSVLIQPGYFCAFPGYNWDLTNLWGVSWGFDDRENMHRVAPWADGSTCQNVRQAYSSSVNVTRYQLSSGMPYICFNGTGIRNAAVLPA